MLTLVKRSPSDGAVTKATQVNILIEMDTYFSRGPEPCCILGKLTGCQNILGEVQLAEQ